MKERREKGGNRNDGRKSQILKEPIRSEYVLDALMLLLFPFRSFVVETKIESGEVIFPLRGQENGLCTQKKARPPFGNEETAVK
jgi:hypothetical protein